MQEALIHMEVKRLELTRGVYQSLADFCWLAEDLSQFPTRLHGIVPLQPMMDRYHDTYGYMCGGAVLLGLT